MARDPPAIKGKAQLSGIETCASARRSRDRIFGARRWIKAGLWSGEIQQHNIRALLHSFEDNFTAVWGDIEVANVEIGSELGQLPLDAGVKFDRP